MKIIKMALIGFVFVLALGFAGNVQAQGCQTNLDCQNAGFPPCFVCQSPNCVPTPALCDDGNSCTEDDCNVDPPGCTNIPLLSAGDVDLATQCYICEPTANGVVVDNGVCDSGAGETCATNPEDCLVPGETCTTPPNLPSCTAVPNRNLACADGDRCTIDSCSDTPTAGQCIHDPRDCSQVADGCCPGGCTGPVFGGTGCSPNDLNCDPDCWSPQDCGDAEVQPPETCDDSVPSGEAGIRPNGLPVGTDACRDAGELDECTYCGDGILQPLTEECDGALLGSCGGDGCNTATCQCNNPPPTTGCLEGSGNVGGGNGATCNDWACSLSKDSRSNPLGNILILGTLAGLLGLGWLARSRA